MRRPIGANSPDRKERYIASRGEALHAEKETLTKQLDELRAVQLACAEKKGGLSAHQAVQAIRIKEISDELKHDTEEVRAARAEDIAFLSTQLSSFSDAFIAQTNETGEPAFPDDKTTLSLDEIKLYASTIDIIKAIADYERATELEEHIESLNEKRHALNEEREHLAGLLAEAEAEFIEVAKQITTTTEKLNATTAELDEVSSMGSSFTEGSLHRVDSTLSEGQAAAGNSPKIAAGLAGGHFLLSPPAAHSRSMPYVSNRAERARTQGAAGGAAVAPSFDQPSTLGSRRS